ncbi:hypothetical protein [Zunongwangia profunda]|uniref:hypothetical protein n=1 Tax=Zunongwangia profunda TaxID=398743 RepID=UPI001D1852D8|nr:hypothetical protein [Zunongwangia profunda]MCC4228412.1 hypothetical protein [Zunongwangia profunda]
MTDPNIDAQLKKIDRQMQLFNFCIGLAIIMVIVAALFAVIEVQKEKLEEPAYNFSQSLIKKPEGATSGRIIFNA